MQLTKTLLVMQFMSIFIFLGALHLSAHTSGQLVSFSGNDVPIRNVLKAIEGQSDYVFFYEEKDIQPFVVSVNWHSVEPINAIEDLLSGLPLNFSVHENTVLIKRIISKGIFNILNGNNKPPINLRGNISNEKGEAVSGASITIKGKNKGTVSSADGYFELKKVEPDAILIISGVGIYPTEHKVSGKDWLEIKVMSFVTPLQEVTVNKGYYSEVKRFSTGNVGKISGDVISKQPVTNPIASLQGRIAGLTITQSSGTPGGAFTIRLRGQNSIANGNEPLVVIDGVPFPSTSVSNDAINGSILNGGSSLNLFNPADIESVEVLKDADATAIYGSRGANGVILITTKRGKSGKTSVDLSVRSGFGEVTTRMKLLNTSQYLQMRHEAFANDGRTPTINNGFDLLLWDTTRYTDWQKELIGGTANFTNVQLALSTGNSNNQFTASLSYNKESTVFPGDFGQRRITGHTRFNHISPNKRFVSTFSTILSIVNDNLLRSDLTYSALTLIPHAPELYDSSGNLNWENRVTNNPMADLMKTYSAKTNSVGSNASLSYSILPTLQVKISGGYTNIQVKETALIPLASRNPADGYLSGSSYFSNSSIATWIVEPQLNYSLSFGDAKLTFTAGATFQENKRDLQSVEASGFSSDALLTNIAAATNLYVFGSNNATYRYNAIFGRINLNLKDRYIFNATARRDGSSRFGPGKQFSNFGALGAAWVFSESKLFTRSFLSTGKLRASYGLTGNDQIGDYGFLNTYRPTNLPYNGITGLYPMRLFNPDFAWETNKKFEAGLEIGVFQNKLFISASHFINRSSNQLIGLPLAPTTGFASVQSNLPAVVENTGWEFEANYIFIKNTRFSWNGSVNLTIPKNKLVRFDQLESSVFNDAFVVGQSLFSTRKFRSTGVNPQTGVYQYASLKGDSSTYFPDYPDDLVPTKPITQLYYGGITNNFKCGRWELDVFVQFTKQNGLNYLIFGLFPTPGMRSNQPDFVLDRWRKPGDVTQIQKFSSRFEQAATAYSYAIYSGDNNVSDASYMRLKNVSLSYSFIEKGTQNTIIQGMRLYLQGQNLMTWTSFKGMDPENYSTGVGALPPLRMITAGLQLNF